MKKRSQAEGNLVVDDKTINELVSVWFSLGAEAYWIIYGIEPVLDAAYSEEYWVSEIDKDVAEWRRVLK